MWGRNKKMQLARSTPAGSPLITSHIFISYSAISIGRATQGDGRWGALWSRTSHTQCLTGGHLSPSWKSSSVKIKKNSASFHNHCAFSAAFLTSSHIHRYLFTIYFVDFQLCVKTCIKVDGPLHVQCTILKKQFCYFGNYRVERPQWSNLTSSLFQ